MSRRLLPMAQSGDAPLAAAEGPPPFPRIGVVGLGLMGGSIALACRQVWPSCLVIGVDRNDVLEQAMVRHVMDVAADDLFVLADADLVVLAAPVRQNITVLASLPEMLKAGALVTDVGSTKRSIVEAARRAAPGLGFVGGHPLAGAARGGIQHAAAGLFRNRPWILTPGQEAPEAGVARLADFVRALGARPHVMTAAAHDRLVAFISHVPQIVASSLMAAIGDEVRDEGLALAGNGLADTTRLASSPATIWADICASNADEIGPALDRVIAVLQRARAHLGDADAIADIFDAAAGWRDKLTANRDQEQTS